MRYLSALLSFLILTTTALADAAPAFSVKDIDGKTHTLSEYKGKVVVLEWFNPTCPFVKKHYEPNSMQKFQESAVSKGVIWLTVDSSAEGRSGYLTNSEAHEQVKTWSIKSSALVLDPDGTLGKLYGAKTTPHMFVIDQQGELAYQGAIDDNSSANKSTLEGAHNYVDAAVSELLAGKKVSTPVTEAYGCSVKYSVS